MKTTIKDIAQACGCSAAAVSLALAGKKGRVSPGMSERILRTAAEMQYTPNRAAVSLATRRTKLIGVLCERFAKYPYRGPVYGDGGSAPAERVHVDLPCAG